MPLDVELTDAKRLLFAVLADDANHDSIRIAMALVTALEAVAVSANSADRQAIGQIMMEIGGEIFRGTTGRVN